MALERSTTAAGVQATSGSANTLGSYAELIAVSGIEAKSVIVNIQSDPADASKLTFTLAYGASFGTVVIEDFSIENSTSSAHRARTQLRFQLPVPIPAGSRIGFALRSPSSGKTGTGVIILDSGGPTGTGTGHIKPYGFNAGTTLGTSVTPNATANTMTTTPVELIASTGEDIDFFFVEVIGAATASNRGYQVAILTGAASSEVAIPGVESLLMLNASTTDILTPMWHGPFFHHITAGTRLSTTAQSTAASASAVEVVVHGGRFTFDSGGGGTSGFPAASTMGGVLQG